MHNLFSQHVGKVANKNKYSEISDEEKEEYFLFLLKVTVDCECFTWKVFDHWKENGWTTLASMNDYWMVNINLSKIKEAYNILVDENLNKTSNDGLKINYHEAFLKIFSSIFDILYDQNFNKPIEGAQTTKSKYLNNIGHFIKTYSSSNAWTDHEKALITLEGKLKFNIFDLLIEKQIIKVVNSFIEFNEIEINYLKNQKPDASFFKGKTSLDQITINSIF